MGEIFENQGLMSKTFFPEYGLNLKKEMVELKQKFNFKCFRVSKILGKQISGYQFN